MKHGMRMLAAIAALSLGGMTKANTLYSNGFETGDPGTADFYSDADGSVGGGGHITVVPSGGGTLKLTAASGNNYAEITDIDGDYGYGDGDSVYTRYAGRGTGSGGPFYTSTAFYIDTTWAAASANNSNAGFWIDSSPNSSVNNHSDYDDETNFRIIDNGDGNIGVDFVGLNGTGSATITQSGWYTFKTTYVDSGGFVGNTMSVLDSLGNTVGSYTVVSSMSYADLDGISYSDMATVWDPGFANETLGIDDVEIGTLASVPLPASAWSGLALLGGLGVLGGVKRLRRQMV